MLYSPLGCTSPVNSGLPRVSADNDRNSLLMAYVYAGGAQRCPPSRTKSVQGSFGPHRMRRATPLLVQASPNRAVLSQPVQELQTSLHFPARKGRF
jgi:hypothetical protein